MTKQETSKTKAALTKKDTVLKLLNRKQGASVADIQKVTQWQPHTVRSFLSATVREKLGLNIISSLTKKKVRRYSIEKGEA